MNVYLHPRIFAGAAVALLLVSPSFAQTTIATGSIVGTVIDPSDAVVPDASITISRRLTGDTRSVNTNSTGTYTSGALIPGPYVLRVTAKGFRSVERSINVQVGVTSEGNVRLQVGRADLTIVVQSSDLEVNTEQATVQGVLNAEQIDTLPINGRNFLDLAQLEPGVQIQDGANFDPSKVGYSSISFGGRFGRNARIEVDGVDVSDEAVGTTTQNIPASAIQEFQLSQSMLDLSTELTSSGSVNVVTRSGTNSLHGEVFGLFRDSHAGAELPHPAGLPPASFQRTQFGGRFGGPVLRNRLFFFIDGERAKQELQAPVDLGDPFTQFSGTVSAPFRETTALSRVDYQFHNGARLFYRFSYFQNRAVVPAGYQPYATKNYARQHAVGLDFTSGTFTHSIRVAYLKFQNQIVDATKGSGLPFANLPVSLNIGPLSTGPNFIAPQQTIQSNHQAKYDGTKIIGAHILRYGLSFNRLHEAAFASFLGLAPVVASDISEFETNFADNSCGPGIPCFPGGASNPLNYPVEFVQLGNGQGFFSEQPALGFPAGGFGPDYRLGVYVGDTWRVRPTLTLIAGVRYVRDTGRTDNDLPPIPELNALGLGPLGDRVRQPNTDFAPQLGFAWDPFRSSHTSIRGGIGLFYDNVLWNNAGGDRPTRLKTGAFGQTPFACFGPGVPLPIPVPGGSIVAGPDSCGTGADSTAPIAIGLAAQNLSNLQASYQQMSPFDLSAPNPNYVGTLLTEGLATQPFLFAPDFKTPRSLQMNIGIEREIRRGTLFSADFVRNVTTHYLLGIDANHVGDVRYFDKNAALAAIASTNAQFGCPPGLDGIDCSIHAGANVHDYAGNGLTSAADFGGVCTSVADVACAFPGINPNVPRIPVAYSNGRSVYNGLHLKLRQNLDYPAARVRHLNLQVSYALSRFVNAGALAPFPQPGASDQDVVEPAVDARNPLRFMGPSLLDRTHQLSFGAFFELVGGVQFSFLSHFYSPLPLSLVVPPFVGFGGGKGAIFGSDFTGDGRSPDLVPGTDSGAFMREVGPGDLNALIGRYNNSVANQPTPAGQVLIENGLFTLQQLQAIGAVAPTLNLAPAGQVGMGWLRAFDFKLAWSHKLRDPVQIQPSLAIYNLFNFANFDLPPGTMTGRLSGQPGCLCANHTTAQERVSNRVGIGTGVFALGAPRVFEFGLRVDF